MRKFIDALIVLFFWFVACLIFAIQICTIFGLYWNWAAFAIVWAVVTFAILWNLRTDRR